MKSNDEALPQFKVVPYDPGWPAQYQAEQQEVRACLLSLIQTIEHIGSTAVPNLQAKPIIDMMASSHELGCVQSFIEKLAPLDYRLIQTGMRNRLLFRRSAPPDGQMFHLHIVEVGTWAGRKERIMRDYLLYHPQEAADYGLLKEKLALTHAHDSLAYTMAKTDFIQDLMDKACDERGLTRINVRTD